MSVFPREISVAMAYVPFQQWCDVYQCDKALCQGTIFPVLDLPFMGVRQR
ncbi:MAG: spore coat associated protein CotJA [Clostridia bacterium]|nr:spore coat associated protein CotJA [Clostridia bacterium]MBO7319598.1 spore coat associated protein CotJA [Clostridia bacterium]